MFDPETKRAATVVQIGSGRTEAGWWPVDVSGQSRGARGGKRFGPEVNMNTLLGLEPRRAFGSGVLSA
jgi:hypothetical protein